MVQENTKKFEQLEQNYTLLIQNNTKKFEQLTAANTLFIQGYTNQIDKFREDIESSKTKGRDPLKKTFSFGHCPNYLTPPPHDPNLGNLVLFFRTSKFKI